MNGQQLYLQPKKIQLGDVIEGKVVAFSVGYVNNTQDTISVLSVKPACGCTSIDFAKVKVPPGSSGEFKFEYDTKGKDGLDRKTITVVYKKAPPSVLVLTANIIASKRK